MTTPSQSRFRPLRRCPFVLPLLIFTAGIASADDLLKWDITGAGAVTGSDIASAAALGVSGSELTGGGTTGNSTSPSGTWNRRFDVPTTSYDDAQTEGNYFSFTTTAEPGYTVSISGISVLGLKRTTAIGEATIVGLFYSTDGTTFTQTGTSVSPSNSTLTSAAAEFSSDMAATPIVMEGGETIHWRIVVTNNENSRLGLGKEGTEDLVITGVSVPDVAVHNLLWTGAGGSDWNTAPGNTNWADIDSANAPAPFITNDNVTIDGAATIAVDAGGVTPGHVTVNAATGTISLSGGGITGLSLTKNGGSTLSLDGTNAFSAGVVLDGGILSAESADSLGTGAISINNAILSTPGSLTPIANAVGIGTAGATIDAAGDVEFSNTFAATGADIEESNALTKTGPGVLTLTKTGSLAFGAQSNVGATGTSIDFDITEGGVIFSGNGSRYLGGTCTWDAPVTLEGGTLMLHGSVVDGTGAITVTAPSTIIARFNRGQCDVGTTITLDDDLNVESPTGATSLYLNGGIDGAANLIKDGNGLVVLGGDNSYDGTTTVQAGTLRIGAGTAGTLGTGDVLLNVTTSTGTLDFRRDDALVVPNLISGEGNLVVNCGPDGSVELAGDNGYTGITTISGGTLIAPVLADVDLPSSIGSTDGSAEKLILRGGATLSYTGPAASTDREFSLGGAANGSESGGGTISVDGSGPLAFSFPGMLGADGEGTAPRVLTLAGSAPGTSTMALEITDGIASIHSVVKSGSTTWELTGINSYTGPTTVEEGTLILTQDYLADSSTVSIAKDAVLDLTHGAGDTIDALIIDGVQVASGSYGGSASDAATKDDLHFNPASTGYLIVTSDPVANDYDDWAGPDGYDLAGGPDDDDDKDGLSNREEYAFGLDPTSGSSVSPVTAPDTALSTFTYTRRNPSLHPTGLSYSYGSSTTLVGAFVPFVPVSEDGDDGDPVETVTVTIPAALLENPSLFIQVTAQ